jgi:hypothetical protein
MQYRNACFNQNGTITCEIEHPAMGWIPFTAATDDVEAHGRKIYSALIASGKVSPYIPQEPPVAPAPEEM